MKRQINSTTIQCQRNDEFNQQYVRIDTGEDFYSKLKLTHTKQSQSDYLEINASLYSGVLTKSFINSCLSEMQKDLSAHQITSLKLIGLTDKNCEAELFRKSPINPIHDSSFINLKEVVIENGFPQDVPTELQPSTTLPSKPFLHADLDFLKIDGRQTVPENFLSNADRVGMLICPDNENTHEFLTSPNLDNVFATLQNNLDTAQAQE